MFTVRGYSQSTLSFADDQVSFTIPAATQDGDIAVVMLANNGGDMSNVVPPDGWAKLDEAAASSRSSGIYSKQLKSSDAGTVARFDCGSAITVGGMIVLDGGTTDRVVPPASEGDGYAMVRSVSTTTHNTAATDGLQGEDLRLVCVAIESNAVTLTMSGELTVLFNAVEATSTWRVALGYMRALEDGSMGDVTNTTSANASGILQTATIQARVLARPGGLVSDHNGNIGLQE